jgi:hypothetical protein
MLINGIIKRKSSVPWGEENVGFSLGIENVNWNWKWSNGIMMIVVASYLLTTVK